MLLSDDCLTMSLVMKAEPGSAQFLDGVESHGGNVRPAPCAAMPAVGSGDLGVDLDSMAVWQEWPFATGMTGGRSDVAVGAVQLHGIVSRDECGHPCRGVGEQGEGLSQVAGPALERAKKGLRVGVIV